MRVQRKCEWHKQRYVAFGVGAEVMRISPGAAWHGSLKLNLGKRLLALYLSLGGKD